MRTSSVKATSIKKQNQASTIPSPSSTSQESKQIWKHKITEILCKTEYTPRKSRKSPIMHALEGDGDIWIERIVWDENRNEPRSYFKSQNTNTRKWDEPPSGASRIILAAEITQTNNSTNEPHQQQENWINKIPRRLSYGWTFTRS